ncbi:MAG: phosphoribosyltransferase family protein [Coriobacteriia bacterium]|nr:phosphoribosyltransferase family protein [Coriobacteriia bacterium]
MWRDRAEAGRALGEDLVRTGYAERDDVVVLGIPRGGVEVARGVADALAAPLDVVVVRKVGHPGNPEFAAGSVDPDGNVYENPGAGVSRDGLTAAAGVEHAETLRRLAEYRGQRPAPELAERTVIVVDDGIATGLTALAAIRWLRSRGARRVVLASPVVAPGALASLAPEADAIIALSTPGGFRAVGAFYEHFPQLSDADVAELLAAGSGVRVPNR